jgi:serine/threonine protein kinase
MNANAQVKIFNFDESSQLETLLPAVEPINISSIEDFITKLKKSKGIDDKPVRIVSFCPSNALNIVKFSLDLGRNRALHDEIKNNISLLHLKSTIENQHIAKMTWYSVKNRLHTNVMCCEYVKPLRTDINTLRQLAEFGGDAEFRQALFQTLFALYTLQKKFVGFRHNDFKADNVLVTQPPRKHAEYEITNGTRIKRFKLDSLMVWIKIIDFEVACTPTGKYFKSSSVIKNNPLKIEKDYGLSSIHCDVFDVHLLFFDIFNVIKQNVLVNKHFTNFVKHFIPLELFDLKNMTCQFRIRISEQEKLHKELNGKTIIFDMLNHSYFSNFFV